jgi:cytochrome c oxidase subunit II
MITPAKFQAALLTALSGLLFASCRGPQSAVDPAGIQSERLGDLWWVFFYICLVVYLSVMAVLLAALFRRKKVGSFSEPDVSPDPVREKRAGNIVKGAVAVTLITLFVLMAVSFRTGRAINSLSAADGPLTIKIKGQQWWWSVEYTDELTPSNNVRGANELHIPTGRPIKLELESNDVIHSFWLPNMHGKKDLIPNYPTVFYFQADNPGTYWGQCAEFCGYQHAKMRFVVTAESPEEFNTWLNSQRQIPPPPSTESQKRGQQIFLTSVCTQCHTVRGTSAAATVGPDLTHVASKSYIGAASLENTRDNLARWITDPQKIKPGIKMPMNYYTDEDLSALVDYLETLK